MNKETIELTSRFYAAEITVWILSAVLAIYSLLGIELNKPIPFFNITLQDQKYFPHIISSTLLVVLIYLFFEYKQSPKKAKDNLFTFSRIVITVLFSGFSLWLIMPRLVENTSYEGVSIAWYFAFVVIGLLLGFFTQTLIFATLMIRDKDEAKRLNLPQIPNAARAQYIIWLPILLLMLFCYYTLHFFSPNSIVYIGSFLTAITFLYMIFQELIFFYMHTDKEGNITPHKERIGVFKEVHSMHDRSCELNEHGEKHVEGIGINKKDSPKEIQKKVREHFSVNNKNNYVDFSVKHLEEIQINLYPKDGNHNNNDNKNYGFKILKSEGHGDLMHVMFIPKNSEKQEVDMFISLSEVVRYAEDYVVKENEETEPDALEVVSKAIHQTVIDTISPNTDNNIMTAIMSGDVNAFEYLIKQGNDINERFDGGWTALLASSAQGYPKILKQLLGLGANPDISNVLGVTPLIFGAMYGNIRIVKELINYGADLNLQDSHGDTALMIATLKGNILVVDTLLDAGADITIKNHRNKKAINLAYDSGNGKISRKIKLMKKKSKRNR